MSPTSYRTALPRVDKNIIPAVSVNVKGQKQRKSNHMLLPRLDRLKAQVERDLMALVVEGVQDDQGGARIGCQD